MDVQDREKGILPSRYFPFVYRRNRLYISVAAAAGLATLLIFLILWLMGPRLSASQKQWKRFSGDDLHPYSLKVVSHGYRMVRVHKGEGRVMDGRRYSAADLVEWEWKVVLQNTSNYDLEVYVNYYLMDKDHLLVDIDSLIAQKPVPAGNTITVQRKTEMVYADIKRVVEGVWELSWTEDRSSHLACL